MAVLKPGTVLADMYQIIEEIGAGGGGIVFRAKHLRLQTDVVVKKIRDDVRSKVDVRAEADILKNLKHPYLPRVYDFIETPEGVYTVIDYIEGDNLEDVILKQGAFPEGLVRKWAVQLGEALDYLHSQNPPIIHSDIKPANVMLTKEGDVCLIDFNISLAMGESMESAVGISAGYSPPEQYRDPATYARITQNYTQRRSQAQSQNSIPKPVGNMPAPSQGGYQPTEVLMPGQAAAVPSQGGYQPTEVLMPGQAQPQVQAQVQPQYQAQPGAVQYAAIAATEYGRYFGRGINTKSDIYSLGATLFFFLTGALPDPDFSRRMSLDGMRTFLSDGFARILDKMMSIAPELRYKDGGDYLNAIRNIYKLDRQYVHARRIERTFKIIGSACAILGALVFFLGLFRIKTEKAVLNYEAIEEARSLEDAGDYEGAVELSRQIQADNPTSISGYEEEVYALYLAGDYDGCIERGDEFIQTTPFTVSDSNSKLSFGELIYLVGNAYYENGKVLESVKYFETALEYNNENGLIYRDYAIALARTGDYSEAKDCLEQAEKLDVDRDSILLAEAEIASAKEDYDDAKEYFDRCIEETEDSVIRRRAITMYADMYNEIGEEAIDDEIELLENNVKGNDDAGNIMICEYLANAYAKKAGYSEDESETLEYYQKSLDTYQAICDEGYLTFALCENMAIINENMDRFDTAEEILVGMTKDYPKRYESYKRLAFLEADKQQNVDTPMRDYSAMKEYYERAVELYSGDEDFEMDKLGQMIQELADGGWFIDGLTTGDEL